MKPLNLAAVAPSTRFKVQGFPSMDLSSAIDFDYLHQMCQGDPEFEQELLSLFLSDTQVHLNAAKTAASCQESETVRQKAHLIRGASGTIGAVQLQALAGNLEQMAKQGNLDCLPDLVRQLEAAYQTAAELVSARLTARSAEI